MLNQFFLAISKIFNFYAACNVIKLEREVD